MPLFIPWYIYIPKECFSPLKQSTTAWASLREEDQQQDQDQDLQQVKSLQSKSAMSYINRSGLFQRLSVFKSCVALAFITRTAPATVPLHPLNISLQGMWGCAVSPRKSKAGWTVTMVIHRSHSTLEAPESPLASRLRSFDMVGRLFGQACQMAQQRTQWGVRLDCST